MTTPSYQCSQSALYSVTRNIAQSLTDNLADFTAFKAKYVAAYVTDLSAKLNLAELTPDFQARSAQSEIDYIAAIDQLNICTNLWQALKRYIIAAYPLPQQKARLDEAGGNYYERAIQRNWDSANALLLNANNFINIHNTTLEANLNMPISFKATFNGAYDTFVQTLLIYRQGEEEIKVGTVAKLSANNDVYNIIKEVCNDGQYIYKSNEPVKDQFTFSTVLSNVSGIGTTGFKGYIYNAATGDAIPNASITTLPGTKSILSDDDGFYDFKQIPAGTYSVNVNCPGFLPFLLADYVVDSGIQHNLQINLNPLPVVIP